MPVVHSKDGKNAKRTPKAREQAARHYAPIAAVRTQNIYNPSS